MPRLNFKSECGGWVGSGKQDFHSPSGHFACFHPHFKGIQATLLFGWQDVPTCHISHWAGPWPSKMCLLPGSSVSVGPGRGPQLILDCFIPQPGGTSVGNPPANAGDMRRGFDPWVRKIPWRRKWQLIPVFLPKNSTDRGAWWAAVHSVSKSWTWLSN